MKNIGLLSLLLLAAVQIKAQDAPAQRAAKAIYVEGLGSGLGVSINFDTRFKPGLTGLGLRAGIGGIGGSGSEGSIGLVTFPVLLNYVVGNSRVSFEAGAGVTAGYITVEGTNSLTGDDVSAKGFGVFGGAGNFGLRLQPKRNGAHFRLYWSPFVTSAGFQPSWLGASLGFGFR